MARGVSSSRASRLHAARAVVIAASFAAWAGCASGGSVDAGGSSPDASRRDSGASDAGATVTPDAYVVPVDAAMTDAGPACGGEMCTGFTYCNGSSCVEYPACRGDGTCPTATDVCRSRRCVPGDVDIDGDGDPASTDCDETNVMRSSTQPEICDDLDNNCNGATDDGNSSALCDFNPAGGICLAGGVCGCPDGTYDFDRTVEGCECSLSPALEQGTACGSAIDVGTLSDVGVSMTVTGNALPVGREVWYHFYALDNSDAAALCDTFNVGIHFASNPDNAYEFTVIRGACDTGTGCAEGGYTDFNFATDFRGDFGGTLSGECPCWVSAVADGQSQCSDNSTDIYVRVRRRDGAALACAPYVLTLSNGVD